MKELICNGLDTIVSQALNKMKEEQGNAFNLDKVNLAELHRKTGISRSKLRRMRRNGFKAVPHGATGKYACSIVLSGYTGSLDDLLRHGIKNSQICYEKIKSSGYSGSLTTVKRYIARHKALIPAKRILVEPQGNRGRRFVTEPGEAYQMDWGFTNVSTPAGKKLRVACFAIICHHCGQRFIEFFPNAKQENLFIGMIYAFRYMGIPRYVLTDNMASVVTKRDYAGNPVWQKDYEAFMKAIDFQTKLCKPRHPFTKGKVERLIRFVKENFLPGRTFWDLNDLNRQAWEWCINQNDAYHKATDCVPKQEHSDLCMAQCNVLVMNDSIRNYLCPVRRISFDGFISYEDRRYGVPFNYTKSVARVQRKADTILVYSDDMKRLLTTHMVPDSRKDSYCPGQYASQPEEFPTAPVKTTITLLNKQTPNLSFEKFNFDKGDDEDE